MKDKQSGHWYANLALALCSGMLGGVLTLLLTNKLSLQAWPPGAAALENPTGELTQGSALVLPTSKEPVAFVESASLDLPVTSNAELQRAFDDAAAERTQLAGIIAQLTEKLDTIESDFINQQSRQALGDDESTDAQDSANSQSRTRSRTDILVAAGLDIATAELIQARQNEYQLQRLDLIDLSEREGWRGSDQYKEQLEALNEQRPDLREELGDSGYDRFLYESGRNNRVRVDSIIGGSAADLAGLQVGDVLVDYADSKIFSPRELRRATRGGVRGESITVGVQRQGQLVFIEVPRGPLGVGLDAEQENRREFFASHYL